MVSIKKSRKAPVVRFTSRNHPNCGEEKYIVATRKICDDYKNNPNTFLIAGKQFNADFGSEKFRLKLISLQGNKCCYCEKPIDNGQIEHYRPKAAYQEKRNSRLIRPGYYWLAYDWDNFLISCGECNQAGRKGNLFPIYSQKSRAKKKSDGLKKEKPVIINPAKEDPSKFISFHLSVPIGVDKNGRGKENILLFDLKNRPDLKSAREDILDLYITKKDIASLKRATGIITLAKIDEAKDFIKKRLNPKLPFSGMLAENIKNGFI